MFTVEFEHDAIVITSLDETERCEDIQVIAADDGIVFLRQFEEAMDEHQLITITYRQLLEVLISLQSREGAYYVKYKDSIV